MKAIQVRSPGSEFELVEIEVPQPGQDEVLIRVEACGVCHGESVVKEGRFPGIEYPRVPGHEVIGIIDKLGSESKCWEVGQRVGVGWHAGHCHHCLACRTGNFGACEDSLTTGLSSDGGYAEYMVARMDALSPIPEGLDPVTAAPILCAGRTTFGALKHSDAKGGDLVAVHGFGGLGHLAVQYANKLGFRTAVISRNRDKEELAHKLGAHHYIDSCTQDAGNELMALGGAKLILATAPDAKVISQLVGGLGRRGNLMIVTYVGEPMTLSPAALLRGEGSISGWVGGNPDDALRFSALTKVMPMVEVYPLEHAAIAYERMMTAKVRFRAVLKIGG
jgi:D-arabinose 1-dehydrogenase-like Zn-dependent alcohol dehydrogenase